MLEVTFQGTGNLYAIVRRRSDSYVWDANAGSFVVWADGDVADYAIALTSAGGDLYKADFPTAITAGTEVRIIYYKRAGATPATTDLILASKVSTWNGSSLVSAGDVALVSWALTTLASVKRHMGLATSDDDDLLRQLINHVSGRIERYCDRRFKATDHTDFVDISRGVVVFRHWPLIRVKRVASGFESAVQIRYSGSDVAAIIDINDVAVTVVQTAANGTDTTTTLTFADYPTTSDLATAINALTGFSTTLIRDVPSKWLRRTAGQDYTQDTADDLRYADDAIPYEVDLESGIAKISIDVGRLFATGDTVYSIRADRRAYVEYRAGYETIPQDVEFVANEIVKQAYDMRRSNGNLQSESLGEYSYTLAAQADRDDMLLRQLAPYRVPPVGGAY